MHEETLEFVTERGEVAVTDVARALLGRAQTLTAATNRLNTQPGSGLVDAPAGAVVAREATDMSTPQSCRFQSVRRSGRSGSRRRENLKRRHQHVNRPAGRSKRSKMTTHAAERMPDPRLINHHSTKDTTMPNESSPTGATPSAAPHLFTITVNNNPYQTAAHMLTGAQIKALANIPADYELFEIQGAETIPVTSDQEVHTRAPSVPCDTRRNLWRWNTCSRRGSVKKSSSSVRAPRLRLSKRAGLRI